MVIKELNGQRLEVLRFSFAIKLRHANSLILRKRAWWAKTHPHAKYPKHLQNPWQV